MIINQAHRVRIAILPLEADAPLAVYPQAVQMLQFALFPFKAVAGRIAQVIQAGSRINLEQPHSGAPLNSRVDSLDPVAQKQGGSALVVEAFNHGDDNAMR